MKQYDLIVIGSGCGSIVASEAVEHELKVAFIDRGPLGGTCLNVGCIPSKMLIYPADRIMEIQESGKLGITARITGIDFKFIMDRMRKSIAESRDYVREGLNQTKNTDYYEGECHFIADYTIEVNNQQLKADKIVIATGSRPFNPPLPGLNKIDYLTNESVLQLTEKPESLIMIGGGYISVEYAHFFAAMGTRVTIVEMANRLILSEEPEIAELLKKELGRRIDIRLNAEVNELIDINNGILVKARDKVANKDIELSAQRIMMAVGRKSNADTLKLENTGVEMDKRGFIKVNEYLETNRKNIFAIGDANGQQMFTHVANKEAAVVIENMLHGADIKMNYAAAPHAVFTHPQIASVGLSEEAAAKSYKILVGKTQYTNVAKGDAMAETESFAKSIIEQDTGKILGFHIIGPSAPDLIQEVVNAMESNGNTDEILQSMHIHPSLSELVPAAITNLEEPNS
jgi:mycothione reductase